MCVCVEALQGDERFVAKKCTSRKRQEVMMPKPATEEVPSADSSRLCSRGVKAAKCHRKLWLKSALRSSKLGLL